MPRAWPAGAARESLQPRVMTSLKDIRQFAYLPGRGLSDALDRVVAHLREARTLLQNTSPSRHALQLGAHVPDLVGGITFSWI